MARNMITGHQALMMQKGAGVGPGWPTASLPLAHASVLEVYQQTRTMLANTAKNVGIGHSSFVALKSQQLQVLKTAYGSYPPGCGIEADDAANLQAELQQECSIFNEEERRSLSAALAAAMAMSVPGISRAQLQVNLHIQNYGCRGLRDLMDAADTPMYSMVLEMCELFSKIGCRNPNEATMAWAIAWIFASNQTRLESVTADAAYRVLQDFKYKMRKCKECSCDLKASLPRYPENVVDYMHLKPHVFSANDPPVAPSVSAVQIAQVRAVVPLRKSNKQIAGSVFASQGLMPVMRSSSSAGHGAETQFQQLLCMVSAGFQAMQNGQNGITFPEHHRRPPATPQAEMPWVDLRTTPSKEDLSSRWQGSPPSNGGHSPPMLDAFSVQSDARSALTDARSDIQAVDDSSTAKPADDDGTLDAMKLETWKSKKGKTGKIAMKSKKSKAKSKAAAKSKASATSKASAKAKSMPVPKAKSMPATKAKSMTAPKAQSTAASSKKKNSAKDKAIALGLILGCGKCRHSSNGCAQCWDPDFKGARGPA